MCVGVCVCVYVCVHVCVCCEGVHMQSCVVCVYVCKRGRETKLLHALNCVYLHTTVRMHMHAWSVHMHAWSVHVYIRNAETSLSS